MNLSEVTPIILTFDEAPNIGRALERLRWAERVIVLDSFSGDETRQIAFSFPNVTFHQRAFDSHTAQWNHALALAAGEWVLCLDADYVLSPEFADELRQLTPPSYIHGYSAQFRYCIHGRRLGGSLYPPRVVLFRKSRCAYEQDGHTQALKVNGPVAELGVSIDHDDRKPLGRWLWAQDKYARLEAEKLLNAPHGSLRAQDRLRLWILPAPFVVLFYTLFVKRALFDGWPGWLYAFQRLTAELILSLHLLEKKLKR